MLVLTNGTKENHYKAVANVLERLDKANVRLKSDKCEFAQSEIDWLRYKLTQTAINLINSKVQPLTEKLKPRNLIELTSYLRTVNEMNRFIPNLAQLCYKLRPLLKKDQKWKWEGGHDKAFEEINKQIQKIAEVGLFKKSSPIRIICDASKADLGAILQQDEIEWRPIYFASRFLTPLEGKYSIKELELLAVVWAVEHSKLLVKFQVVSDHEALATVLESNKNNKTYSSRLTRWVDRLLPFDFEIIFHAPGLTIGIADCLSRHPSQNEGESVKAAELWNNWFTVNHVNDVKSVLAQEFNGLIRGRRWLIKSERRTKQGYTSNNPRDQSERLKSSKKMGQSQ